MAVMHLFRNTFINRTLAAVVLLTILNFSLNTIQTSWNIGCYTTAVEIESFTELLVEEVLELPNAIPDTPKNDQESSITPIALFISKTFEVNTLCPNKETCSKKPFHVLLYFSIAPERETPPPQVV